MGEQKRLRRTWTKEEKIFFAKLLQIPLKCGRPKSVSEVSKEYGISPKLLYEWLDRYIKHGENGFDQKERKVYESISKDIQLADRLLTLSLMHPDWGAKKLIDGLKANDPEAQIPSIPTVLKILRQNNLGMAEQRYGATEHAYVKGGGVLTNKLIDVLFEHNPYLRLLESNRRINGLVFLLKTIPLSRYFGKSTGSLLVAIEANSQMTFANHWNGKDVEDLAELLDVVAKLGKGKSRADVFYLAENQSGFSKMKGINWLDTASCGIDKNVYYDSVKPLFSAIKAFLRSYQFLNNEKFVTDIQDFLTRRSLSCGSYGYPTFGESPYYALKNRLEDLYFKQLGK